MKLLLISLFLVGSLIAGQKPNILFILADDQSPFDLKIYNKDSILETPNLDALAKDGMVLDGAYHMGSWSGAVCTPSRHMIMSGRTVWHLPPPKGRRKKPAKFTFPKNCPDDLPDHTLAPIFQRAGYETMRTCKRGNSYEAANSRFEIRHDATKRGGTAETGSGWHGDRVMDYLEQRQSKKTEKPFFIYFGFSHPHDVRDGTPELLKKYGATNHKDKNSLPELNSKQPKLPINWLAKHPFHHGHPKLRDEVSVSGVWERRDEKTIRNELGREFACSENIDIQIGRVIDKLKETGEFENTIIVYTADHGMAIGRHGLQGKQNLYQHTWRVPMIVHGPGVKQGRAEGNVYLLDTLATLCDLTGVEAPASNEGKSFGPVLKGKAVAIRDTLFGVYCGGTKPGMRSVKKGPWKLIKYDVLDGKVQETQLFNLEENPHEFLKEHGRNDPKLRNLAGDPAHAGKLKEMEALLLNEMKRLDDPYRLWDQPKKN